MEQRKYEWGNGRWCLTGCVVAVLLWSLASAQLRYSISEGVDEGTVVGNIAKDLGLDKNTLTDRKYRVVSSTADPLFHVNEHDGILYVSRTIDREEVCEQSSTCLINLKTVLENPLEVHYVGVEVLDVNDHSPNFPEKEKKLEISESVLPGARFQLKPSRDPDSGHFSVQMYKLSHNDHFRLEVRDKGEDDKMYSLITKSPLDREKQSHYIITVVAKDAGQPPLSSEKTISVVISDVNDNSPEFSLSPYTFYVTEGNDPGTSVFSVKAFDRDVNENAHISYHILRDASPDNKLTSFLNINSDNGDILALKRDKHLESTLKDRRYRIVSSNADHLFHVNENDGILYVSRKIDREEVCAQSSTCLINLKTVLENPLEVHYVGVEVLDINDHSPSFPEKEKTLEISESVLPGARFQLKASRDRDSGHFSVQQYKLSQNDHFRLEVKDKGEDDRKYRIVSSATEPLFHVDHNNGILYVSRKIDREEVCERSSMCLINIKTVLENPLEVHYVGVEVLDINDHSPSFPEKETTLEISESVLPGVGIPLKASRDPDGGLFSVQQYKLSPNDHFRLEVKDKGEDVAAKDAGQPPLSSEKTISVVISDVNDNSPEFSLSPYTFYVTEGNDPGTSVFSVKAFDRDVNENAHISYHILRDASPDNKLTSFLNINSDNGDILALKKAFAASDVKSAAKVDDEDNVTFYLMITLGSVSVLFIISIIVLIAMQCSKTTDYTSKYLQDTNYDGTLCHSIQYRSGDKRYMLVGPRMSIGSTIVPGSHANTLVLPDRRQASGEIRYSISEEVKEGSVVGNIAKDLGIDKTTLKDREYRIVGSSAEPLFHVNKDDEREKRLEIFESTLPGARFQLQPARDPDGGQFSVQQYKLSHNDHFRLEVKERGEDHNMYAIVTKSQLDREEKSFYEFTIVAKDTGEPSLSCEKTISVVVSDVNDNRPQFSMNPYIFYITENNGLRDPVFSVRASDLDDSDNAHISYHIPRDSSGDSTGLFLNINSDNGDIMALKTPSLQDNMYSVVTKSLLDREHQSKYDVTIVAKDAGEQPLLAHKTISVTVSDVNDNSPEFSMNPYTFYVTENNVAGAFLFSVSAYDCDEGDNALISFNICSKTTDYTSKYLQDTNYDGTLCHSIQYRSGDKRYMLVGPRMSIGSTIVPGSHANTLVLPDRRQASGEVRNRTVRLNDECSTWLKAR
ncbi:hypothetical protein PAMP_023707 [Pampus punctatissimus]